jgi:prepilin-type N-terminal cleavage/methylation domain-containing protein
VTRRGFSLLEMLLTIAIVLALSGSVYAFLFELMGRRDRILGAAGELGGMAEVFDRVQRDLTTAVTVAPGLGAGVRGGDGSLRIASRGVLTPGLGETLGDEARDPGDLVAFELRFDAEVGAVEARVWPVLIGGPPGEWVTAMRGVERFRVRFHDGRSWRDRFDSRAAGRLPVAVELSVWRGDIVLLDDDPDGGRQQEPVDEFGLMPGEPATLDGFAPVLPGEDAGLIDGGEAPPDRRRIIAVPGGSDAGWSGSVAPRDGLARFERGGVP